MHRQASEITASAETTRRISKFSGELVKVLQTIDRTPTSNWASLSNCLGQLIKCLESNVGLEGDRVPYPTLVCRVIFKCLDPKGVMGVHRKALEVVQCLIQRLGATALLQQTPLIFAGVLNLLPRCSLQVKCVLLNFVDIHILRVLPAGGIAVQLPGIIPALLTGLEEGGESEVYRLSMKLLRNVHDIMRSNVVVEDLASARRIEEAEEVPGDKCSLSKDVWCSGVTAMYRVMWLTLKNSPSLRGPVLQYLKLQQGEAAGHAPCSDVNEGSVPTSHVVENGGNCEFGFPESPSVFLGRDPCLVHSAIFITLQDQNERTRRFMLDLLIAAFPLGSTSLFTASEQSLLVSAVVQLLGIPDSSASTRRRVVEWLIGPLPDAAPQFIQNVSSFDVAQAFHRLTSWWRFKFGHLVDQPQIVASDERDALDLSHYHVLHMSACKFYSAKNASSEDKRCDGDSRMAHVLPTVWLKALMVLFDSTVGGDAAEDDDAVLSKVGPVNDCIDGFGEFNGTGMSSSITPFRVFLLPLVLPYVCDLLVSMAVLMEKGLVPDDSLETTLSDFFASVPWMYFVNYQRSIILSVGTGSKRFLKVASPLFPTTSVTANETDCFSVGNTDNTAPAGSQGLLPNDSDQEMLRAPVSSRGVLEGLELSFLQLKGMTSLIQKNVVEPLKGDLKQCTAFRREVLSMCHSLCGIMCTASAALLEYSSVNGQLSTYEGSSTLEVALCLLEESLHVFDRLFFNVVSPLSNKEDPFMIAMPEEESELGLLAALWESASGFTKFMSRHPTGQKDLFARIAKSIFALVSYMFSSGWRKTDLCEEALNGWLRTVASAAASSATLAVQRDSLRVFVDFLNSTEIPPHVREGVREKNQLKQQLVPHVWHLLGICNEGMQADVVELLLRLYTDEEARRALDVITTEETMECGERLVILFSRMAEVDAPQNYFLPGLYMLLRALAHQNSSLRWLAQSTIRQFIPYFHRLLNPLLISLTRQLVCFSTQAESSNGTEGQSEMASTVYSAQELHDYEVNQLDPVGFVHVVRCILSNPATLPQLFARLCSLPAPEYMESHPPLLSLTGTNARSSESEGAGDEVNADSTVLGSAFAALVHVLLGIAYQNLSPRFSKGVSETVSHGGELGVAAVEALTMVLQASRSLPEFTKNVLHTWSVTSVKVVELLHEVVRCRLFPPEQIAMLQHLLDSVRLLSSVDPPKGCASPSSGGDSSCQCTAALKMDLFYEAVEVGVERAATRALLPHGWSDRDLLSVWCDTLVGLIPHLYEQREEGSTRILRTLIRVIEQQVRTASSLKDCTVFRVVQVCLNGIYCVLEYCFVRERECAIRGCSSAKVGGGSTWFGARVGIFGGNSSLREQKLLEPVVECTEMMWDCMRCIVATLFKVHCCARRVLEQATRSGAGSVLGRGDSRPLPSGSAEVAAAAQVEESICRVLCLYKESVAKEFFRVFIEVWASRYAPQLGEVVERSMRDNGLPNTPGASLNATGEGVRPNDGKASLLSIISTEFTPRDLSSPLWEQESVVQLLNTGAATDALALINGVKEILADAQVASSAVVPHCELFGSGLTLDTAVLYFIHVFLRVSAVPSDDIPRVQAAVANFFYAHLAARTVTVTGLSFMLLCLSHFPGVRGDGGALDSSISTLGAGKDKRGSSVLCKVLDALSSIGCITSVSSKVDPNALYFALSTVGYALPRTVPVLQPEHDRITSSAVSLFRRSVFPVVAFGIDAQIDEDAHSRTPLVQTALEVAVEVLGISEINSRRLRQELLDGPCSWDFFRLPRRSLHRYRLLFTRLSQDSTFHAEIVQHFTPSPTQSNRFGGLVSQSVSEEQQRLQRAVQVRRLAFYVASMPALPLMADRELCLLLRDQIAEALRLSSRGASSVRCTHGNVLAREAMFLFRVLLTKFEPVLLQPFWPLVLPEMVCALTEATSEPSETTEGGSGKDGSKMDGEKVELLSFQLECLKVLHFALVIMPEVVAPFCWVFVDDLGVVNGHCLAGDAPHPFVPIVQRRAAGGVSPAPIMQDLQDATVTGAHITGRWMGKQQPLLRLPSILNGGPQGVQACAAALVLFSRIRSIICSANHTAEEQQQLMPCLRLLDGWDEEYLNYLLDVDFSCIHEGVDAL